MPITMLMPGGGAAGAAATGIRPEGVTMKTWGGGPGGGATPGGGTAGGAPTNMTYTGVDMLFSDWGVTVSNNSAGGAVGAYAG